MMTAMDIEAGNPADDTNATLTGDETENRLVRRIDARRKAEGRNYTGGSYEQIAERVLLDPRRPFVGSENTARVINAALVFHEVESGRRLIAMADLMAQAIDARECLSHLIRQAAREQEKQTRRAEQFAANACALAALPQQPKRGRGRPRKDAKK